jgi:hypothetical protein
MGRALAFDTEFMTATVFFGLNFVLTIWNKTSLSVAPR